MTFNLLALDGGGIRGYMSARIMHQLEQDAGIDLTAADTVDGYCGTSTGGLLSIALANAHTPEFLAHLYKSRADEIFLSNDNPDFVWIVRLLSRLVSGFKDLITGVGIFDAQYQSSGLESIARELVKDKTFGEFDSKRVLAVNTAAMKIPGATEGWTSTTFCNQLLPRSRIGDSRRIKMLDGAMSTSAAPSYFPPHQVVVDGASKGFFADGGVFANNPVMNGITVAKAAGLAQDEDFRVISIGTGINTEGIPQTAFSNPASFGILQWLGLAKQVPYGALLSVTMTASADNMTWISGNILKDRMIRLNPVLKEPVALDDTNPKAFQIMDDAANALFASPDWADAVAFARTWAPASGA